MTLGAALSFDAQVSNEDGFWSGEPGPYLRHVFDAYTTAWGAGAVVVHSTDSVNASLLASTHLPGQFQTVDFGSGPSGSAEAAFAVQAAANAGTGGTGGPAMNSEYYVGGVNRNWGDPPYANDTAAAINASAEFLRGMLVAGASVNLYMFSGGTNWGFEAGLHADGPAGFQTGPYIPGGPLTEAGDASPYFGPVCAALSESQGLPPPPPPPPAPKSHYMGELEMTEYATLWDALPALQALRAAPAVSSGGLARVT
jgi:beta-galactosidase